MAKNVTVQGASYPDVPAVNLPQTGGGTARFTDTSGVTATASDVASGKVFVDANGILQTGTASSGGGSSWTKVAETTYQVTTTSTSETLVATFQTGNKDTYTSDAVLFVRVRDTAGKRNGYFYGSDTYIYNKYPLEGGSTQFSAGIACVMKINSSGKYLLKYYAATNCYGIYASTISPTGNINIYSGYNSSSSGTIDGTYKVEVYLLDPPTGSPIFV